MRPERKRSLLTIARKSHTVPGETPVWEAAERMARKSVGSVEVVSRDGKLAGIFTERDLLDKVVAKGLPVLTTPVSKVMTTTLGTVRSDTPLEEALEIMLRRKVRHLPIVGAKGEPLGILRFQTALVARAEETGSRPI